MYTSCLIFARRAGVILASKCSILSLRKLWLPSLISMAAEGWGGKEICTKGAVDGQKKERGGDGEMKKPARSHCHFAKLRLPRTEFLIGAVKLQLSITSQMCHLSVILTFRSCGRKRKMANSDCKIISFHSALEEALKCLSEFNMSRALKSEQKEAISTLVCGKDLLAVLPTGFWKSLIFQVLVLMKEIITESRNRNLRA